MKLYDELVWRGLIENITDESLIEKINNILYRNRSYG